MSGKRNLYAAALIVAGFSIYGTQSVSAEAPTPTRGDEAGYSWKETGANTAIKINVDSTDYYTDIKKTTYTDDGAENHNLKYNWDNSTHLLTVTNSDDTALSTTKSTIVITGDGSAAAPFVYTGDHVGNTPIGLNRWNNFGTITGDFVGNTNGAIAMGMGVQIPAITGNFIGNTGGSAFSFSGDHSWGSTVTSITGDFIGNYNNNIYNNSGGAIYIFNWNNGGIGTITGDFIGNKADGLGGAIALTDSHINSVIGNFVNNYAGDAGGALLVGYGKNGANISVTGDFIANQAVNRGGAVHSGSGANTRLIDTSFIGNIAPEGAAIYLDKGELTVTAQNKDIEFTNNNSTGTAGGEGYGIYHKSGGYRPFVLNAYDNRTLTVNDKVYSEQKISINNYYSGDWVAKNGTVIFNNEFTQTGLTEISSNEPNAGGGTVIFNGTTALGDLDVSGTATLKLGAGAGTATIGAVTFSRNPMLDLANNSAQTLTVESIKNNAKLNIDLDFTGESVLADAINITTGGKTGVLTINDINPITSETGVIREFTNLAILTGATDGVTLALSEAIQQDPRFQGEPFETLSWESDYSDTATFANTVFTNTEYLHTKQKQLAIVDGIKLSTVDTEIIPKQPTGNVTTQDVLQALNQSTSAARSLTTNDAAATYTAAADLGTTGAGSFSVTGTTNVANVSTLNMNDKSGFELSNADTTLTLSNLNITNINDTADGGLLNITGDNSSATLTSVTVDSTTNSAIVNDKTLNLAGNTTINTGIKGSGTINIDGTVSLNGPLALSGTTNISGGTLKLNNTAANSITNSSIKLNGGTFDIANGTIEDLAFSNAINNAVNSSLALDVSLGETNTADKITSDVSGTSTIYVSDINFISDNKNGGNVQIADGNIKSSIAVSDVTGGYANVQYNNSTGVLSLADKIDWLQQTNGANSSYRFTKTDNGIMPFNYTSGENNYTFYTDILKKNYTDGSSVAHDLKYTWDNSTHVLAVTNSDDTPIVQTTMGRTGSGTTANPYVYTGDYAGNNSVMGFTRWDKVDSITGDFVGNTKAALSVGMGITIGDIIGNFIGNTGDSALYMTGDGSWGQSIHSITGDFIGNFAGGNGGAIYLRNYDKPTIDIITGDFIGNKADGSGGAIYLYNGKIDSITGNFVNNYAGDAGGAIYGRSGKHIKVTGDFIANQAVSRGGAIFNDNTTLSFIDSSFIGNIAPEGAAIYSGPGNGYAYTYVSAQNKDIEFTNNNSTGMAGGEGYGIYHTGTVLILNAGADRTLTINDKVYSTNYLRINQDSTYNEGRVIFNNELTQTGATEIYSGTTELNGTTSLGNLDITGPNTTLKLGSAAGSSTFGAVTFSKTPILDVVNNSAQTLNVASLKGNALLNFDIDFTGESVVADAVNITTGGKTGSLTLNSINNITDTTHPAGYFSNLDILKGTTEGATLVIATDLYNAYLGEETEVVTRTVNTFADNATFGQFDDDKFIDIVYAHKAQDKLYLNDTKTKLSFENVETVPEYVKSEFSQDVLQSLNQSTNVSRSLTTDDATATYTVGDNLGATGTGSLSVTGTTSGENKSSLNMNGKSGFELSNANTTLNLTNLNITGFKDVEGGLINITGANSKANLENVTIANTTNSAISNSVELNLNGTNYLGTGITGTGTTKVNGGKSTVVSITQNAVNIVAGELEVANITTTNGISNAGSLTLTGTANANTISGIGTTTINGGTTTVETLNQNSVNVSSGNLIVTNLTTSDNTVTNNGTLTLNGISNANTVTGSGNTIISGNIINTGVINQNTEIASGGIFTTNTSGLGGAVTNNGTLVLSGDLDKKISSTGTTKVNTALTMLNGASVDGILDMNGGTLNLSETTPVYTNYSVGTLKGNGNLAIDFDGTSNDMITATSSEGGTITLTALNGFSGASEVTAKTILSGASNITLAVSDGLRTTYDTTSVTGNGYDQDEISSSATWTDSFKNRYYDVKTGKQLTVDNSTENKTLAYKWSEQKVYDSTKDTSMGDTLALVNQKTDTTRNFTTTDKTATYKADDNIGVTGTGTMNVTGATDSTNTSGLDMNGKTGFELSNADTVLNLKNLNVTGVLDTSDGGFVSVTGANSEANLENVTVNATTNNAIVNDKALNLSGTNNLGTGVTGSGTTTVNGGETTVGTLNQKTVDITSGNLIVTNLTTTDNAVTNDGTLTLNGTGNTNTITGGGNTVIDGNVTSTAAINQAINVNSGKTLTTAADLIGGDVANTGTVDLTGGTLSNDISGTGTTSVTGTVDVASGSVVSQNTAISGAGALTADASSLQGDISNNSANGLTLTGGDIAGNISGKGTTNITGAVTNSANKTLGNDMNVSGSLSTNANGITGNTTNTGTVELTGGTLSNDISGTGKTEVTGAVAIAGGSVISQNTEISGTGALTADAASLNGDVTNNAANGLTLTGGNVAGNISGSGTTNITGAVTNNSNKNLGNDMTVSGSLSSNADNIGGKITSTGNVDLTGGTLNNQIQGGTVTVSGDTTSDATNLNAPATVNTAKTLTLTGGTISNPVSGAGNLNITADVINTAVNTVTGNITVANGVKLSDTTGNMFASATSVAMGNNSVLNFKNGTAGANNINNVTVSAGDSVKLEIDWLDTVNSSAPGNIAGNLVVSSVDLTGTDGSASTYLFTNTLQDKVSLASPLEITGTGKSNFVKYNNITTSPDYGKLTSYKNSLENSVAETKTGESATYSMTGDESANNKTLTGTLKVQGNGNTLTGKGATVGTATTTGADLTFEDTNINVTGDAIEVYGDNKATVKAQTGDLTLTSNSNVISLKKGAGTYADAELSGANTITVSGDTVSDDVNNVLTVASGTTVDHSGSSKSLTENVNGTLNRVSGSDSAVTYNVNFGGKLNFQNDSILNNSTNKLNLNGGSINLINDAATAINLAGLTLNSNTNFYADVDLANKKMDNFLNTPVTYNAGTLHVAGLKLISDAASVNTSIPFATGVLKSHVDYTGPASLTALSPIYKYSASYDSSTGNFDFTRFSTGGAGDYNPAVLAAPVAAQLGGYFSQLNSYEQAFRNTDMYMLMPKEEREAMKFRNKHADSDGTLGYDDSLTAVEKVSGWVNPYATFEKVELKKGPKVKNTMYGSYFGLDSGIRELGKGWDGIWGVYAGYNGSHQHYDGIGIYQNGGTLGMNGTLYKDNFFTSLTVNVGANAGQADSNFGNDDFAMLMTGVASKTGYNWELTDGKFIIQPNYTMSYTMVNTFDYTNAAGVRINSDPLHAIQFEPGIKFIGNLKNGWQPYAGVSVVWNAMDKTDFHANNASLPNMSVKPFVKYGVGVRKTWGERLTGFLQAFVTNGGRNGVGLQAGFRFALGKDLAKK